MKFSIHCDRLVGRPSRLIVVSLIVAGLLAGCSGLTSRSGVWVVTKAYLGDEVYYENEYDGNGLILKNTNYYDGDQSTVSYTEEFIYEDSRADKYTVACTRYEKDGSVESTYEKRYEEDIDKDGRLLTMRLWASEEGPLKESDLAEDNAIVTTFKYDEDGNIREETSEDADDAPIMWAYRSIGYDTYGYRRMYEGSYRAGTSDASYELSYSDDGVPQAVAVDGNRYTFDTDNDGNIIAIYDGKGELLRQFEYKYVASPAKWISRRVSVYEGCKEW